jgi:hypothetical protein
MPPDALQRVRSEMLKTADVLRNPREFQQVPIPFRMSKQCALQTDTPLDCHEQCVELTVEEVVGSGATEIIFRGVLTPSSDISCIRRVVRGLMFEPVRPNCRLFIRPFPCGLVCTSSVYHGPIRHIIGHTNENEYHQHTPDLPNLNHSDNLCFLHLVYYMIQSLS